MLFGTKNYLKNNRYHIAKHVLRCVVSWNLFSDLFFIKLKIKAQPNIEIHDPKNYTMSCQKKPCPNWFEATLKETRHCLAMSLNLNLAGLD